ncbi:ABC transporter ATP-binding protein [Yinghuangia soli]|uniref:ABC transporter ATP-binding protein n=1 Tax=Yinghuangia soli TaxID=2908204 RepID=A0AA41Q5B6_9ACTN|nr:ABC transporter ATP-binding protein [Yinghuangia soli]MCF2531502.1 ABC transporter ATP-binding protein [Yinghuangia soli]
MNAPDAAEPVIAADNLSVRFPVHTGLRERLRTGRRQLHAVDGVSLAVRASETVALIGESGSGKSTFGKALLHLETAHAGAIRFHGDDVTAATGDRLRELRRRRQLVFQNPYAAINRRRLIRDVIAEPLRYHQLGRADDRRARVHDLAGLVGLSPEHLDRYPHELSGGQLQRVVIARALALEPEFLVADEPTASLDVSVGAQIVNLFADMRDRFGLALLYISHDLPTVAHLADRIAVMYLGRIVESAPAAELVENPRHPYTQVLLASVPRRDPGHRRTAPARGEVPDAADRPSGCHFRTRCPLAMPVCAEQVPAAQVHGEHMVACHAAT